MNLEKAINKGDVTVKSKEEFEDPGRQKCEKCGESYKPLGIFIKYFEEYGYVGDDPGYCPTCIKSNGYEHTGKKNCEECGSLYDPRYYMNELKEGIWSGEDLGKCLECANPFEVEQNTYALSCSVCDSIIPHGKGITAKYHHDSKRKTESVIVCSRKCEDKITRTGY